MPFGLMPAGFLCAWAEIRAGALAAGRTDDAIAQFTQAVERDPGNVAARRALLDAYRLAGRNDDALKAAENLLQLQPDDVLTTIDAADLNLALGRSDAAVMEYQRLTAVDDEPEHEVYAYHGMIQAEIQRDQWRRALDLAIEATRVDRYGRILRSCVVARTGRAAQGRRHP